MLRKAFFSSMILKWEAFVVILLYLYYLFIVIVFTYESRREDDGIKNQDP